MKLGSFLFCRGLLLALLCLSLFRVKPERFGFSGVRTARGLVLSSGGFLRSPRRERQAAVGEPCISIRRFGFFAVSGEALRRSGGAFGRALLPRLEIQSSPSPTIEASSATPLLETSPSSGPPPFDQDARQDLSSADAASPSLAPRGEALGISALEFGLESAASGASKVSDTPDFGEVLEVAQMLDAAEGGTGIDGFASSSAESEAASELESLDETAVRVLEANFQDGVLCAESPLELLRLVAAFPHMKSVHALGEARTPRRKRQRGHVSEKQQSLKADALFSASEETPFPSPFLPLRWVMAILWRLQTLGAAATLGEDPLVEERLSKAERRHFQRALRSLLEQTELHATALLEALEAAQSALASSSPAESEERMEGEALLRRRVSLLDGLSVDEELSPSSSVEEIAERLADHAARTASLLVERFHFLFLSGPFLPPKQKWPIPLSVIEGLRPVGEALESLFRSVILSSVPLLKPAALCALLERLDFLRTRVQRTRDCGRRGSVEALKSQQTRPLPVWSDVAAAASARLLAFSKTKPSLKGARRVAWAERLRWVSEGLYGFLAFDCGQELSGEEKAKVMRDFLLQVHPESLKEGSSSDLLLLLLCFRKANIPASRILLRLCEALKTPRRLREVCISKGGVYRLLGVLAHVGLRDEALLEALSDAILFHLKNFSEATLPDLSSRASRRKTGWNAWEAATLLRWLASLDFFPMRLFRRVVSDEGIWMELLNAKPAPLSEASAALRRLYEALLAFAVAARRRSASSGKEAEFLTPEKMASLLGGSLEFFEALQEHFVSSQDPTISTSDLQRQVALLLRSSMGVDAQLLRETPEGVSPDIAIPCHDKSPAKSQGSRGIALQVEGSCRYTPNANPSLEPTLSLEARLRNKTLALLGWRVVSVPFWKIRVDGTKEENTAALLEALPPDFICEAKKLVAEALEGEQQGTQAKQGAASASAAVECLDTPGRPNLPPNSAPREGGRAKALSKEKDIELMEMLANAVTSAALGASPSA